MEQRTPNPFQAQQENPFAAAGDDAPMLPPDEKSDYIPPSPTKATKPSKIDTNFASSTDPAWAGGGGEIGVREQEMERGMSLDAREADIKRREEALAQKISGLDLKNYPSFYPMVYNNIKDDIPPAYKGLCQTAFLYVHVHGATLLFNWICNLADFSATCFFISLIYCLVGWWAAWNLQYRRLYKALSKASDVKVFIFLFNFFVSVGFDVTMAVGIPGTCGIGLWQAMDKLSGDSQTLGFMYLVSFIMWTINSIMAMYIFKKTLTIWKQFGGSVDKMKAEAEKEAGRAAIKHAANSQGYS